MQAFVEVRTQSPRGSGRNHGPDVYVAVQIVPDGVDRLKCLNRTVAEKRGIQIIHCGEGYQEHQGPRSAFGRALSKANALVEQTHQENNHDRPN